MGQESGHDLSGLSGFGSLRSLILKTYIFQLTYVVAGRIQFLTRCWSDTSPGSSPRRPPHRAAHDVDVFYQAEQVREKELENASCFQNEELSSLISRAMGWREQSLEKVRDLAVVCGQGISPGKTLSSYRASCFVTQVPGDDGRERCQVGGGWDQYGFGHQTHLLIKAAVQPQTLNVAGNSGNNGGCISAE